MAFLHIDEYPILHVQILCVFFVDIFQLNPENFGADGDDKDSDEMRAESVPRLAEQPTISKYEPVVKEPVLGVSDQVRHKPGCTSTEDG